MTAVNGKVVHIPAKSAIDMRVRMPKGSKTQLVAIVVTPLPGSGPVYAARAAVIRGSVQTVQSVVPSPARVELSPVRESLLAVLGS